MYSLEVRILVSAGIYLEAAIDVSPLVPLTSLGPAKTGSLQRTVETVDNNELLSITYPPNPTPSIDTLSFSTARLWSCASGFNTSFPSDTPVVERPLTPVSLELVCRKHGSTPGPIARHAADAGTTFIELKLEGS